MISVPGDSSPTVTKMAAQIAAGTLSSAMARVCLTRSGGPTGDSAAFFAASAAWDRLRSDRGIVAIRARVEGRVCTTEYRPQYCRLPIDVPSLIPGIFPDVRLGTNWQCTSTFSNLGTVGRRSVRGLRPLWRANDGAGVVRCGHAGSRSWNADVFSASSSRAFPVQARTIIPIRNRPTRSSSAGLTLHGRHARRCMRPAQREAADGL